MQANQHLAWFPWPKLHLDLHSRRQKGLHLVARSAPGPAQGEVREQASQATGRAPGTRAAPKRTQITSAWRRIFRQQLTVSRFFFSLSAFSFDRWWLDVEAKLGFSVCRSERTIVFLYQFSLQLSRSGEHKSEAGRIQSWNQAPPPRFIDWEKKMAWGPPGSKCRMETKAMLQLSGLLHTWDSRPQRFFFLRFYLVISRERWKEGEVGAKLRSVASCTQPDWGSYLQPSHVPRTRYQTDDLSPDGTAPGPLSHKGWGSKGFFLSRYFLSQF